MRFRRGAIAGGAEQIGSDQNRSDSIPSRRRLRQSLSRPGWAVININNGYGSIHVLNPKPLTTSEVLEPEAFPELLRPLRPRS